MEFEKSDWKMINMQKITRFIKTSFIYFMGNMLSKMVAFFLLPLYTSRLLPEQYGTYDLVLSLINLIAPIAFFQIWDGMFRYAFDYDNNEDKYGVISNTIITYLFGITVYVMIFSVVGFVFKFDHYGYAMVYGFFFALQYLYTYIARLFLRNKLFVLSGTVNTLISALINIILILKFNWGVESLYLAPTVGCALQIIIIELNLHVISNFDIKKVKRERILEMLKFSLPLCVATVSYWLLSGFTKVIITNVLGTYENGLYAVANRFASMITLFVSVFQFAWNETAYLMANDDSRERLYSICVDIVLKVVFYGCALACLLIKIVFPFMIAPQYHSALLILPAAIIGVSMNSVAGFLGTLFMTEKKTMFILYSTLIAAGINCIFGYILSKTVGLQGAVVALALAFTVLMCLRLYSLKKKVHLKISGGIIINIIPLVLSVFVFYKVDSILILGMSCCLLCVLFILSVRSYIKQILKNRRSIA